MKVLVLKLVDQLELYLNLQELRTFYQNHLDQIQKLNMATATLNALKAQKTREEVAALRGKKVEEILIMKLHTMYSSQKDATKVAKRKGRGVGSGNGKTCWTWTKRTKCKKWWRSKTWV